MRKLTYSTTDGNPPDFALKVASAVTADNVTAHKRLWYAGLGIPEYWRFDETGNHHTEIHTEKAYT